MACSCPKPTALTAITATSCPEEFGQIQRIWLVRKGFVKFDTVDPTTGGTIPVGLIPNTPDLAAGWTILKAAVDDTKVVMPPLFGGDISITPGDSITQGGNDNSTLNGATYITGKSPSTFSARYDQLTSTQTSELNLLECEDLEVYFINEEGDLIGRRNGDFFQGFDISTYFLGERNVQGIGAFDSNVLTFQLAKDWDQTFEKVTPSDFNALTF